MLSGHAFAIHEERRRRVHLKHVVRALALIDDLLEQILVGEAGIELLLGESGLARELEQVVERFGSLTTQVGCVWNMTSIMAK